MGSNASPLFITLYAKDARRLASFYQAVLQLHCTEEAPSYSVLASTQIELIVIQSPAAIAQAITLSTPPTPRESTPIKPSYLVADIESLRQPIVEMGGVLKDASTAWTWRGSTHLDAWDREGNVFQLRQLL